MAEHPILFSAPMVRAILSGAKTQTRRVVKGVPPGEVIYTGAMIDFAGWVDIVAREGSARIRCPFGKPGDRLWVRETWSTCTQGFDTPEESTFPVYRADTDRPTPKRWIPSIHMPRWASRITLEVTGVRVERLHALGEADAIAEGMPADAGNRPIRGREEALLAGGPLSVLPGSLTARECFAMLWNKLGGAGAWDANPWVWVIEFRRLP